MWLFHFRSGSEQKINDQKNAEGTGHAIRCLRLKKTLEDEFGIESKIIANKNSVSQNLLKKNGIHEFFSENLLSDEYFMSNFDIIISDINYLEPFYFKKYAQFSTSVCLAPRGEGKFLADISFRDTHYNDTENIYSTNVYSGPEYVITGNNFKKIKKKIHTGEIKKNDNNVIVSMGGLDHFDMTNAVVLGLINCPKNWNIKIIIGPMYNYINKLKKNIGKIKCNIEVLQDPNNFYQLMASSNIGIFGSGITSFEGAGLGLISFNLTQSEFHENRAKELEQIELGFNAGKISSIRAGSLSETIIKILNRKCLNNIKKKGMSMIDGNGNLRIIKKILEYEKKNTL